MESYKIQTAPFIVPTPDGKLIEEHFGLASINCGPFSIAHMVAPPGGASLSRHLNLMRSLILYQGKNNLK